MAFYSLASSQQDLKILKELKCIKEYPLKIMLTGRNTNWILVPRPLAYLCRRVACI